MLSNEALKTRALKALYNVSEIDDTFIDKAIKDANEISAGRAVIEHFVEDYAYIRLKIYLKIELSEEDELIYKEALKAISAADFVDENGEESHFIRVKTRESLI